MQPGQQLPTEAELPQYKGKPWAHCEDAFKVLIARNILEARQALVPLSPRIWGYPMILWDWLYLWWQLLAVDMLDVRMMLEPSIAALAAIHATPEQKEKMQELTDSLRQCIEKGDSYAEEDGDFHTLIAEASATAS